MSDGSSGLSLSEMGISTVKKTAQAVKKQATPFVQGVKQQITGQGPAVSTPKPQSPAPDSALSGVFDIFADTKKQITGSSDQAQTQQANPVQNTQNHQAAQPPDETNPAMSGTFDLTGLTTNNDQTLFEKGQSQNTSQNSGQQKPVDPSSANPFATMKSEEEKQQEIEMLRKKLHDAYYEQFEKAAEGKDGQKEETVQERLEREEQEKKHKLMIAQQEEEKKKPIVPPGVQGRQGAHEGLKNRG